MGLIGSIKKNFSPAAEFKRVEKIEEVQEEVACLDAIVTCQRCGSNDWWLPAGSIDQRCFVCQKPSSLSLVGCHYFFDDLGVRWLIETGSDGREVWTKESF
jgi:hypothetical protein